MLLAYFNISGLGSQIKKTKVNEFIAANSMEFVAIQET